MRSKKYPRVLAVLLVLGGAGTFLAARSDDLFALRKAFEQFSGAFEALITAYADPLDPERSVRHGIDAMLAAADPYTNFYDERTVAEGRLVRGGVGRVGVELALYGGRLVVAMPGDETSGYRQGLRPGDALLQIAGRDASRMAVGDAFALLAGAPGTSVEVVVEREGMPAPIPFTLVREAPSLRSVTFAGFAGPDTTGGVGIVRLAEFGPTAGSEVRAAVERLHGSGRLSGLVLDLRGNPGGVLEAAVEIVGLFVPENTTVVTTQERGLPVGRAFRTSSAPLLPEMPVVVLVDGLSASASEVVAGALQDLDRGVVAGEATFGKGLIQRIRMLPYRTAMKITVGRYVLPSGRVIQKLRYEGGRPVEIPEAERRAYRTKAGRPVKDGRGVEPDVRAAAKPASDFEAALEREGAFARYAAHLTATSPARASTLEADLGDFRRWLGQGRFAFATSAERLADSLATRLTADGSPLAPDVRRLRERLQGEREALFARHEAGLRARLRAALLASAGTPRRDALRDALGRDAAFNEALRLARDRAAYDRALQR
jgi:carboxyl-terminal processing protease